MRTRQKCGNYREIVNNSHALFAFSAVTKYAVAKNVGFFSGIFHQHPSVLVFGFILYVCHTYDNAFVNIQKKPINVVDK